jgi:hypothetical protein
MNSSLRRTTTKGSQPMATLTAVLMAAGISTFSGCGISPPETPATLAVADFPACAVKINETELADDTFSFKAGETVNVEADLTLREGLEASELMPVMIHLMMSASNEQGEESATFYPLTAVDEDSAQEEDGSSPNVVHLTAEWTPKVEPGTYELRLYTAVEPMGSPDEIPLSPVFSSIVEIQE